MKNFCNVVCRVSLESRAIIFLLVFTFIFIGLVKPAEGLRCYQCGQYTDGPGSITPCINYTDALHLKECSPESNRQCIKYVNEGSTVRDCAHECNEKRSDSWGTSIYCCSEDGCNSALTIAFPHFTITILAFFSTFYHFRRFI